MAFHTTPFTFPLGDQRVKKELMSYSYLVLENKKNISAAPHENFLGLYFNLRNNITYQVKGWPEGMIERRHYNLVFVPQGSCVYTLPKGNYACFCIRFTTEYLKDFVSHIPSLSNFIDQANLGIPAVLTEFHAPITPDILDSIHDIISDRFGSSPKLREMFLEAKYKGILIAALHHISRQSNERIMICQEDTDKIMKAHELILKDITHSFSMSQLADKVGLDKRVLEKGFKITFGKTVFHFLMDERMKKAHALLRDTDIPANQVANMVGYKRPNTFSDAFKRKFGYSPRAAKNADHNVDTSAEEKETN